MSHDDIRPEEVLDGEEDLADDAAERGNAQCMAEE